MRFLLIPLLACLTAVDAWMPSDRGLFGETRNANHTRLPAGKGRTVRKWLQVSGKVRGVNLGSMFIIEPWMASTEWANMGCGSSASEFDCVLKLGQTAANAAFQAHWARWITQDDIETMASYGINTIRIPVGYWIDESIVYSDSEHFPQGGLAYLDQLVGWASNKGFYIIIDLHGAPGAQVAKQAFTGQYAPTPGFYQTYQYERAYSFLQFITNRIHTNANYRNVGMVGVVNEPIAGQPSLISEYYPTAYGKIRATESSLGVTANSHIHIQFMDASWGAGDPKASLTNTFFVAYDNHRYLKWDPSVATTQAGYLGASCADNVASDGDTPLIVGEWSISPADAVQTSPAFDIADSANAAFYTSWWAAQVLAYEKQEGWIFWAWKAQLADYRWSYSEAVQKGIVPTDPDQAYQEGVC
ncbi:glycoside hydrolase family 5 protein [Lepidopterella palustris CBS 459.81]|uniref:glucan endo-1,6-beta-glucosidase n=1 Tax=Lepidopterella palustris CBS 459.81 TaxID=1314670 RepID=A0A8E2EH91_9PEZI|nr:glycoside hydrolase family 5 protein [Lepidopterella palustris CBS 459.81]